MNRYDIILEKPPLEKKPDLKINKDQSILNQKEWCGVDLSNPEQEPLTAIIFHYLKTPLKPISLKRITSIT